MQKAIPRTQATGKSSVEPSAAPAREGRRIGLVAVLICAVHLVIALALITNWLSHRAVLAGGETMHAQFAWQAAEPGIPLYGDLTLQTSPLWYTPLQFQIAGYLSRPFHYDIRVMRATIAFFGIGSFVLIGLMTRRLTGDWRAGLCAAGVFAGLPLTIPWYVILEPNAGHVFFVLLAVYLLMRDELLSWKTVILAATSLFLCCWAKHTGLGYMLAGCGYIFLRSPKKGIVAGLISFGLLALFVGYYATRPGSVFIERLAMHKDNPMDWGRIFEPVMFPEYLGRVGILFAVSAAAVFSLGWSFKKLVTPLNVLLGATFVVGTVARLKYGSGPTQAIAFYGLLAVFGISYLYERMKAGVIAPLLVTTLMAVQGCAVFSNLSPQFMNDSDEARYQSLLDILSTPGKKTYYNCFGYMNREVGREVVSGPSWSCWKDGRYDRSIYPQLLRDYWGKDPMDLVIIDLPAEDNSWFLYERLNANYVPVQEIPPAPGNEFGSLRSKKVVLVRKDQAPARR